MLDSLGWAIILGDSRGFFRRDFSSRVRRLVASGDAMVKITERLDDKWRLFL